MVKGMLFEGVGKIFRLLIEMTKIIFGKKKHSKDPESKNVENFS